MLLSHLSNGIKAVSWTVKPELTGPEKKEQVSFPLLSLSYWTTAALLKGETDREAWKGQIHMWIDSPFFSCRA